MEGWRGHACCAAFVFTGLVSVSSAWAQAPAEPTGPTRLPPASVEVVRIDAVVTDKGGHSRAGLEREDFAVFEDGVPQKLVQFEAFARRVAAPPQAPASPASAPVPRDEAPRPVPRRFVVLAIDDVHMEFANAVRIQKALTRFIDEDMGPEDLVALLTTSGAQTLSQEFTQDRETLRRTISRISAKDRRSEWFGVPNITEYQAELIERGDPDALAAAVEEIQAQGTMVPDPEAEARRKAQAIFTETVYQSRLTLEALERLIGGLARLPGRKVIFLLSDGFLTGLSAYSGAGFDIRRIADACTRAGVVIYSLETRGLTAPPGLSPSTPSTQRRATLNTFPIMFSMQWQSEEATRQAMHALAADTGGFLAENSNDLHAGLRRMLEDAETYYVLAYEPTNTKRDGAFRHIEVRLPRLRDLKVRARSGYFAPGDRGASSPSGAPAQDEGRRQRRSAGTGGASAPLAVIPVHLSADFVSVERGVTEVVVSGHADSATLPFVRRGDRYDAVVEMTAVVHDETGAVAATLTPQRMSLDMTEGQHEVLSREGLPYQQSAALKAGRYEVRFVVREAGAGAVGVASQQVEIPDLGPGRLTLSSLFLLKASGSGDPAPLVLNQARRRFRSDESLYAQLYAYNAARDGSGATDLVWQAKILNGGVVVEAGAPEPLVVSAGEGPPVPYTRRIKLDRFGPGEYELEVSVTDQNASAVATRRVGFTID